MKSSNLTNKLKYPVLLYKSDCFSLCSNEEISIKNIQKLENDLIETFINQNYVLIKYTLKQGNFYFKFKRKHKISEWSIRSQTMKIINLINMLKEIKLLNE
jgi:hypothetical protein